MINSQELADVLLEEIRLLGQSISFSDAPDLTSEEKFARAVLQFPVPSHNTIASVIEEVFWASLLTEESRPCRPRLLYFPNRETVHSATHRLKSPVPLNRDHLRKLTPVQGPLGYLTWDCSSGKPEIAGIQGRQGGDACDFVVTSPNDGALDISWHCVRLVALRAGRFDLYSKASLPTVDRALNIVIELLGSFDLTYLRHAIRAIANDGHGGSVWILREEHAPDGIQIGHPTYRDEPPPRERYEQRFKWLESVGHLAAVDGAVVVDAKLRALGFGAFIDIPDSPRDVQCIFSTSNVEKRPSNELGGGRHRSAVEFCSRFAPAAAMVVSEDGRISLLWATTHDDVLWMPMSILGFSGDVIGSSG
jgi:hypothetical protein